MEQEKKAVINQNTANATVQLKELETINGEKQLYVTIDTLKGRVNISIGEKNHKKLQEILNK